MVSLVCEMHGWLGRQLACPCSLGMSERSTRAVAKICCSVKGGGVEEEVVSFTVDVKGQACHSYIPSHIAPAGHELRD